MGVKGSQPQTDHSPPPCTAVTNAWNCTSISPQDFMSWKRPICVYLHLLSVSVSSSSSWGATTSGKFWPSQWILSIWAGVWCSPSSLLFLRRYNFRDVLTFSTNSFHLGRCLMQSLQFVIFIFVMSLFTSSSHRFLGLPSDLVSAGDHSYTFFYHAIVWHMVYVSKPG